MKKLDQGITVDSGLQTTQSFYRRRLIQAIMFHAVEGSLLFGSILIGEWILYLVNGIPLNLRAAWVLLPAWWIGTWLVHLVPGWGLGMVEELRRVELLLITIFAVVLTVSFFQAEAMILLTRISFITAFLLAAVLIPIGRICARRILFELNLWGVPVSIYGSRDTIPLIAKALIEDRATGFIPKAVFSEDFRQGNVVCGLPVLGRLHNVTHRTPVAVVALPELSREDLTHLLEGPLHIYNTVVLIPDLWDAPSLWVKPCDLQGILGLQLCRNLLDPFALYTKIWMERLLVLITLPLWGSLSLFLMLLVWLQDFHSPFFSQVRLGRDNVPFKTYKLRTMVHNAEKVLDRALEKNPELRAEWNQNYKLRKDPRITPAGKILRITSLDEIPQLWSILTGKMALVGPRPLPEYHHNELQLRTRHLRAKVLPGVTGLWQVSGRSDSGTSGMDKWDTYYVTNWSIWLDLVILVRTIRVVLFAGGAY